MFHLTHTVNIFKKAFFDHFLYSSRVVGHRGCDAGQVTEFGQDHRPCDA